MDENAPAKRTLHQASPIDAAPSIRAFLQFAAHGDDGPTDVPIHAIHRGPSGTIPLVQKEHGRDWQPLGALRIGQPFLPELCRVLVTDAYFALNTSYGKPKPRVTPRTVETWTPIPEQPGAEQLATRTKLRAEFTHPDTGLPLVEHSTDTLRWLNCCYADIDCYKVGLTVGDTLGAIVDLQDAGIIPPATLFARSGRGLWALWLLVDANNPTTGEREIHNQLHQPWTPQRASQRAVRLYARIQGALVRRLQHLGADLNAVDGPRYAPVPGTTKTTGADRVLYWAQATGRGLPSYTLATLADGLGLELVTHEHAVIEAAFRNETKDATKQAAGRKGHRQRWRNVVAELETLFGLRGDSYGDDVSSRHLAALFHACALGRAGMSRADVEARVSAYWQRAAHARGGDVLTDRDLLDTLKQAAKRQTPFTRMRRQTYLSALRVTPAELTYLDTVRHQQEAVTAPTTVRHRNERQAAIVTAVQQTFNGRVPSVRDMAAHLTACGVPCGNHSTVWRDYLALGFQPRTRAGRPPKLPL